MALSHVDSHPISHPHAGKTSQPPRFIPQRAVQMRDGGIYCLKSVEIERTINMIEAAVVDRLLDRDCTLNRRGLQD